MNIANVVRDTASRLPEKPAVIFQDRPITYRELDAEIDHAAAGIAALGVRKGDRVAVLVHNIPQFIYAYLGIARAGAVMVPLNTMYTADEVGFILADAEARAVVVADPFAGVVEGLRETLPMLEHVIVVGDKAAVGTMTWDQMIGRGGEPPEISTTDEDLAVLAYTSGTTGQPKGAMLLHGNLTANLDQMSKVPMLAEGESDTVLLVLPLFHIYALNVILGLTVRVGATAVLLERFDPSAALDAIERHRVTIAFGAPPMFVAWLATPGIEARDLNSVRLAVSGAAPLPGPVLEQFRDRLGITIWEGYGLTETAPGLTSNAMGDVAKPGSIGKPLPEVEIRLVDENGDDVEDGDPGEIVARGPNVFGGYWRRDQETAEAFRNGWLHTGDVAYEDADGYLFIVDRKKDLIIVSGFNVYPREVEEVLFRHPKVADAAIVGVPHPYTGEAVKAVVQLRPGEATNEEDLVEFCRRSLARFKCPQSVEFVQEIPHTITGKVLRRALRDEAGDVADGSRAGA
ncbi:MAG TPA: long-chain fatty acid--CoA ligase [Actinomycetota bacterium]